MGRKKKEIMYLQPHHLHPMPQPGLLLSHNQIQNIDKDNHLSAKEESGTEIRHDRVGQDGWWDERPVFEGYVQIGGDCCGGVV